MRAEAELLEIWFSRLHAEWLPYWQDMPDTQFHWWNLLIIGLEDATD